MHQKLQTPLPPSPSPIQKKNTKKMMINATQILKDIIALNYRNQNVIHTYNYSVNIQVESTNGYVQVPKNTTSVT